MEKSDWRNTYQYERREFMFDELKKFGSLLIAKQKDVLKRTYGNLLGVQMTKVDSGVILTFAQFYDPTSHCFTFQDFLLLWFWSETQHEFSEQKSIIQRLTVSLLFPYEFESEL